MKSYRPVLLRSHCRGKTIGPPASKSDYGRRTITVNARNLRARFRCSELTPFAASFDLLLHSAQFSTLARTCFQFQPSEERSGINVQGFSQGYQFRIRYASQLGFDLRKRHPAQFQAKLAAPRRKLFLGHSSFAAKLCNLRSRDVLFGRHTSLKLYSCQINGSELLQ